MLVPIFSIVFGALTALAQPQLVTQTDVGNHPESITGDENYLYVSNMGPKADLTPAGDGYISRLDLDGNLLEKNYLPKTGKLDSPTGMVIHQDKLFVNDLNRVLAYDLDTGSIKHNVPVNLGPRAQSKGVSFLNDIVFINSTQAVVSATYEHKLFLIDFIRSRAYEMQPPVELKHPNGLTWDPVAKILYVGDNHSRSMGKDATNGRILAFRVDRELKLAGQQNDLGYFLDGLTYVPGALLALDWGGWGKTGRLLQIQGSNVRARFLGIKGAADFHWDATQRRLFVAQLTEGKVARFDF